MRYTRTITAFALATVVIIVSCERHEDQKAPAQVIPPYAPSTTANIEHLPVSTTEPAVSHEDAPSKPAPVEINPVSMTENQKIERILAILMESDAIFIRNNVKYDGKAAVSHLRTKWSAAGSRVKTANDFIDALASKSSSSGKPYNTDSG